MNRHLLTYLIILFLICLKGQSSFAQKPRIDIRSADPLVKIFRDSDLGTDKEAVAEVARGEFASLQIVVRPNVTTVDLRATVSDFVHENNKSAVLKARPARFVGYVGVEHPIPVPPKDQLRKPPAFFPDPLLEIEKIDISAGHNQPVWITVPVAENALSGVYRGTLQVTAKVNDRDISASLPLKIEVFTARVGKPRLWITNWFVMDSKFKPMALEKGTEEYWSLLRRYAKNMAEHRQNVIMISPLNLAEYRIGKDNKLEIDFSTFDRWVEIFKEEGVIGKIEGEHLGTRVGPWRSQFVIEIRSIKDGKIAAEKVDPKSSAAEQFYSQFLPALVSHLKEKGWLNDYLQHIADEPTQMNIGTYRSMAELVRKYAPEFRIIEACMTFELTGAIDVWVPILHHYHKDYKQYQKRQDAGDEVWFYTALYPQGEYANRLIEQPLIKTRLLHWLGYKYGATGYLHWGYNQWEKEDPLKNPLHYYDEHRYWPAGDPWIVYPGRNGPLDSIRFEAMRDGIVDYELLSSLAVHDSKRAQEMVSKFVLNFDRYNTDVREFRQTRRALLEELSTREKSDK